MSATVLHADVVSALAAVPDATFAAVLCDPPYGLSFMGKRWDYDVPGAALWREVLRVCKPGAALIAFSGTRTYHRAVVQIEDAGWEIRDCVSWIFGQCFPRSLDVSKAIDSAAGAVRDAGAPNPFAARRPRSSAGAAHGALGAAASHKTVPSTDAARAWAGYGTALKPGMELACLARKPLEGTVSQNVQKWGVGALAIDASRIDGPPSVSVRVIDRSMSQSRWPANVLLDEAAGAMLDAQTGILRSHGSEPSAGGASRFFYTPKPCRKERDAGLDHVARNNHPTVKPIALMQYLARLIMPPNPGKILVPFAGSGSEMIGALLAGWTDVTGIEREAEYVEIARARVALAVSNPRAFAVECERAAKADARQLDMFGGGA